MNEMKTMEQRLGSWKPRRPSAKLERRLFGRATTEPGVRAMAQWLMPLSACLVFTVLALNHPVPVSDHAALDLAEIQTMSLSNQHYAAFLPGSFQCEANRLDTFGWTNGGGFPSSTLSIPPSRVNY